MIKHILVALVVTLSVQLDAQPIPADHPLFPLPAGMVWEYERTFGYMGSPMRVQHYERWTAQADTTIEGDSYRLLRVEHFNPGYAPVGAERCAARYVPATGHIAWIAIDEGACNPPVHVASLDLRTLSASPDSVFVGRVRTPLVVAHTDTETSDVRYRFSESVGLLGWDDGTSQYDTRDKLRLLYVDGPAGTFGERFTSTSWTRFYAYAPGDIRVYRATSSGGAPPEPPRYRVVRAGADTTVQGGVYRTIHETTYRAESPGVLVPEGTCATGFRFLLDSGSVEWLGSDACSSIRYHHDLRPVYSISRGLLLDQSVTRISQSYGDTMGDSYYESFVSGIGLVYKSSSYGGVGGGGGNTFSLVYAEANGEVYGSPDVLAIAIAEGPAAGRPSLSRPYPNPAHHFTSTDVVVTGYQASTLELVDVLGRVVWNSPEPLPPGEHTRRVDLSVLPPGLYALRLLRDGDVTAVQFVTKVR